jgi:hypothetical protein
VPPLRPPQHCRVQQAEYSARCWLQSRGTPAAS